MRAHPALPFLLPLLLAVACDEPDHWEARSEPGGEGTTVTGIWISGASGTGTARLGGIVNAPVAPEAIYLGLGGAQPGVSVVDVNGFGQGTGDLATTRFPLNPNIGLPGVVPPLAPGVSSLDAGGAGFLTLVQDTTGGTRLLDQHAVGEVTDLQLGQPLDLLFNNSNRNINAHPANQLNPYLGVQMPGNSISVAPHPNPPRLVVPSPNPAMGIDGEEPTTASTFGPVYPFRPTSPPCIASPSNQLVPGDPFSSQQGVLGLLGAAFPGVFYGPQPAPPTPPPPPPFCPYVVRQQIGHFLYVLDRGNRRVLALNSNRFSVLAAWNMPDPVDLAMAPNLALLAVSNAATGDVWFVDTDPRSRNFHQVVAQSQVAPGIGAIAWQPEGEDLLVLHPGRGTLTLLDGQSFNIRRTVRRGLRAPRALAVAAREISTGRSSGLWHAFVLNGDGTVALFESGPAGPGGIGHDDLLGTLPLRFPGARSIHVDFALGSGCWITHVDESGLGQISRVETIAGPVGPQPLQAAPPTPGDGDTLSFRGRRWEVTQRYGGRRPTTPAGTQLLGNAPLDLAFDDVVNLGALPDQRSPVLPGLRYAMHSGKGLVKLNAGGPAAARSPSLLFVAHGDVGQVEVLELATGARLASIPAPGIRALCDYWRQ